MYAIRSYYVCISRKPFCFDLVWSVIIYIKAFDLTGNLRGQVFDIAKSNGPDAGLSGEEGVPEGILADAIGGEYPDARYNHSVSADHVQAPLAMVAGIPQARPFPGAGRGDGKSTPVLV